MSSAAQDEQRRMLALKHAIDTRGPMDQPQTTIKAAAKYEEYLKNGAPAKDED